jgi:putative tributyrin esterase
MAHLRCDFFSEVLALNTSMTVILPQPVGIQTGPTDRTGTEPPPVLYLLHGLSDDDTTWFRQTSIERYVQPLGLAVVMPQVHRSLYVDEAYGGRYWTFLSEELPALVASLFRVSTRPEDTFVAGHSMGGYGALRWVLRQPERFAAAASLSGGVNVAGLRTGRVRPADPRLVERVFGSAELAGRTSRASRVVPTRRTARSPDRTYAFHSVEVIMGFSYPREDVARRRTSGWPLAARRVRIGTG